MGWFKKLFRKSKTSSYEETLKEDEAYIESQDRKICDACKSEIFGNQKSVHKGGKLYHVKPCWRKLQKMAKQQAFG